MKSGDLSSLVQELEGGSFRALARVISLFENGEQSAEDCLSQLFAKTGKSQIIGITGSPGAGKSTLVDRLALAFVAEGKRVCVLAIDPSSPFSGGALLGDRIRMSQASASAGVFIRSMASRGAHGGLAPKIAEAAMAAEAANFDVIIIETVGVGQAEIDIVRHCQSVVVVLIPGAGDDVQMLKAGVLEIGDIFVVNKSDRDGADTLRRELRAAIKLRDDWKWEPPIISAVATQGVGTDEIISTLARHYNWSLADGCFEDRRRSRLSENFNQQLAGQLSSAARQAAQKAGLLEAVLEEVYQRKKTPSRAASEVANLLLKAK